MWYWQLSSGGPENFGLGYERRLSDVRSRSAYAPRADGMVRCRDPPVRANGRNRYRDSPLRGVPC
jgi:hypothetical protein